MRNCDFYALGDDLIEVLDFVFAQPGWTLIELASQHEEKLRFNRFIRSRGAAKHGSRPILAKANEALVAGKLKLS